MRALITLLVFVAALLLPGGAHARDGFERVKCDAPVPAALIGKRMSNERIVVLEARYKAVALKDLGASEINDHLTAISWMICGAEYMLLQDDTNIVRDVLPFPAHSRAAPEFMGTCQIGGRDTAEIIVAVLAGAPAGTGQLPATLAWKIDERRMRFVPMATEGLACPRGGIITADGGP